MIKSLLSALAIVAMAGWASAACAASSSEKAACRSDAQKFCSSHIGKPAEMKACLADNKDALSEACRKVIESHGG